MRLFSQHLPTPVTLEVATNCDTMSDKEGDTLAGLVAFRAASLDKIAEYLGIRMGTERVRSFPAGLALR